MQNQKVCDRRIIADQIMCQNFDIFVKTAKAMKTVNTRRGLNEIQKDPLRLFDRQIPDEEVLEIKTVLVNHLTHKLLHEVDRVVAEKGISESNYLALEKDDLRTKEPRSDGQD